MDVDLDALLAGSTAGGVGAGPAVPTFPARLHDSTKRTWRVMTQRWEEYYDAMKKIPGGLDDMFTPVEGEEPPPMPASADDAIMVGSHLSTSFICRFLKHASLRITGTVGSNQRPTVDTVVMLFSAFSLYVQHNDSDLPTNVSKVVRQYIRQDLAAEIKLAEPRDRQVCSVGMIRALVKLFFHPKFLLFSMRNRNQLACWTTSTVQQFLRVGSCLKTAVTFDDQQPLKWGDLEIHVQKDTPTRNLVTVTFVPPNGKTPNSRNQPVELEPEDEPWQQPVLFLLAVAHYAGALPSTHTVEQLYDPASLPAGGTFYSVKFAPEKADEPVLMGVRGAPWAANTVRTYLLRASKALGLGAHITPHLLRRTGVVAARRLGATVEQIQDMLAHKRSSMCYKAYVGDFE